MADPGQLAAADRTVAEMCELIGATSLAYLSIEGMQWATRLPSTAVCRACFTRDYPTDVPEGGVAEKLRFESAVVR
jgi:amidophosphoribosyltransferase